MARPQLDVRIRKKIIELRKTGHSLNEIRLLTGKGNSTVFKYIKEVDVLPKYRDTLKSKQGGSTARSKREWEKSAIEAQKILNCFTKKDYQLILVCLYWGEGGKTELSLNNSDPALIKTFVKCLEVIGVEKKNLRITLRIYKDINKTEALIFWSKLLEVSPSDIMNVNILDGKKKGKLKYGMCRVRVTKGGRYFKLIMSMISLIRSEFMPL